MVRVSHCPEIMCNAPMCRVLTHVILEIQALNSFRKLLMEEVQHSLACTTIQSVRILW
jgi:hypothetical protein